MFRLILFITLLGAVSLGINWLFVNDGTVSATWLGYHIEASISLLIIALNILLITSIGLVQCIMWLAFLPSRIAFRRSISHYDKGLHALTEGFAAIASGDIKTAKKSAKMTKRYLGDKQPLALLVDAQAAQMEGNDKLARKNYEILLENKTTKLIGLKGLLNEVRKEGNVENAVRMAEDAYISGKEPNNNIANVLLELYKRSGSWQKALKLANKPQGNKLLRIFSIKSPAKKRELATLNYMQAKELFDQGKLEYALGYLNEALDNYEKFSPAIILHCEILNRVDRKIEASRIIKKVWKDFPLPQLAEIYLQLFDKEKQLREAEKLASFYPQNTESHILFAKAALSSADFSKAREHAKAALDDGETVRTCELMAQIEAAEGRNPVLVQDWTERANSATLDPAWTCRNCGSRTADWELVCIQCSSVDSISWENWKEKQGGYKTTLHSQETRIGKVLASASD